MSAVHFQCPTCQAPLRLENRALFLGRTFACPDCADLLLIEADGHDGVSARPTTVTPQELRPSSKPSATVKPKIAKKLSAPTAPPSTLPDFGVHLQPRASLLDGLSRRPALLGWSVAILFAIVLFAVINSSGKPPTTVVTPPVGTDQNPSAQPTEDAQVDNKKSNQPTESELTASDQNAKSFKLTPDKRTNPNASAEPDNITLNDKPNPDFNLKDKSAPKPNDGSTLPNSKPDDPKPVVNNPPPAPAAEPVRDAPQKETTESIEARLKQKIARFDQAKPIPFVKLLDVLEDLSGVPIVWDLETVDEQLQQPVTLKLPQTTVGEILDALLKQVGLERRIAEGRIELLIPK